MSESDIISRLESLAKGKTIIADNKTALLEAVKIIKGKDGQVPIEAEDMPPLSASEVSALFNRCAALSDMSLCMWCVMKSKCEKYRTVLNSPWLERRIV